MSPTFFSSPGFPSPYGSSRHPKGINFALFSRHATSVTLSLFKPGANHPQQEIVLDNQRNRTGNVWHIFVYDLPTDYEYGYRLDGPYEPLNGHYFDPRHILLDPYGKRVVSSTEWRANPKPTPLHKSQVYPHLSFNWEEDAHPNIPLNELIIYEMHVRGFTQDESSRVKHPGKFLGLIEKIPYLKSLGINAVELMPIHEFNENENFRKNPKTGANLCNYWGYSSVNFFSPMNRYATSLTESIQEFKTLVKELHAQGIEVILDVVFNHTSEGNQKGPCVSFKGIENSVYYMLGPNGEYYNFTGCGNTINANHPVVRELIRDCLRYWVQEMHVDGFRFDLASILTRGHDGIPLLNPPLIEAITLDPILAQTKLIAEAWDAAGLYQVGSFPWAWPEWNGKFRDDIRKFIKGTDGFVGLFATRLCGSEDLYGKNKRPHRSINFVTSHDGFSLCDLVSYNNKHNEENGEENQDGTNDNESWNCGAEGATDNRVVQVLRQRQMRNLHLALMVSQGVPMLLMGDEYGHTKLGNNNTWCQDLPLNWFQWDKIGEKGDFFRFYIGLIHFRRAHSIFNQPKYLKSSNIIWHGRQPNLPDWGPKSRMIAFTLKCEGYDLYIFFNASSSEVELQIPAPKENSAWKRIVDTSLPSPEDYTEESHAMLLQMEKYKLPSYSSLILKNSFT